jgi:hypothetical protein
MFGKAALDSLRIHLVRKALGLCLLRELEVAIIYI